MKKLLFPFFLLLIASCSKTQCLDELNQTNNSPYYVSEAQAIEQVNSFLKMQKQTKANESTKIIDYIYSCGNSQELKSSQTDPLVYVVNFKNNAGYAVVSGDSRVQPILAFLDNGTLKEGEELTDPGVITMLSIADTEYRLATGLPIINENGEIIEPQTESTNVPENHDPWTDFTIRGHQLECSWGQDSSPYNLYTKTKDGVTAPAGCVPTAVAQVLFFWGQDFTMDGYHFNWELMHKHTGSISYEPAYEMIGELYYKLGLNKNLNVTYSESGSGANINNIPKTLSNCGINNTGKIENYNYDNVYNFISTGPIIFSGYAKKTTTIKKVLGIKVSEKVTLSEGHAWVVDEVVVRHRTMYAYSGGVVKPVEQYEKLFHCNWGWSGTRNGYFYAGKFDSETPITDLTKSESSTTEGKSYFYQFNIQTITNIYK